MSNQYKNWAVDVSNDRGMAMTHFVPVEIDNTTGKINNFIKSKSLYAKLSNPPGQIMVITHNKGDKALQEWCAKYPDKLMEIKIASERMKAEAKNE